MQSERIVFAYLDEPPFCFPDQNGGARGCDVELFIETLRELNFPSVEMRLTSFAELLPGLCDGRWTITTPLFVNEERKQIVDFCRPIWTLGDGLLTRQDDCERLISYEAVAQDTDARLVVVADQVQELTGLAAGIPEARLERVATQDEAVRMVLAGRADAYASVAMAHRGYLNRHPHPELAVVPVLGAPRAPGSFALAKSSGLLRRQIDVVLNVLVGGPWHCNTLARYGFDSVDIP